ncbi:MAG TPA: amidohydrolase family protein [Ktedonobacteraceae bacterium]|nr:amidohydrolase family protein [Ktedonobacteraceae bacterium]
MILAITNGTIIDGRGNDPFVGTLLVEEDRITSLGRKDQVSIPRDAIVIDAMGGSILPGLIDCHVHFMLEFPDILRELTTLPSLRLLQGIPRMRATLEAGVTTVRDAGGTPAGLKIAVERGLIPGPRMKVAVSLISQTGGHGDGFFPCCVDIGLFGIRFYDVPYGVADGVEEVRKKTREILRAGADWIKLATTGGVLSASDAPTSSQLTVEEIAAAVYEAAAQEKRCMAHAQGSQGIKNALLGGVSSIEHGVYLNDELIDLMLKQSVYLVPTLVAPLDVAEFADKHPDILPPVMATKALDVIEAHQQSFRYAVEAGVNIAMGTDTGVGKHGNNGRELQLMVENGMSSMQAIVASTQNAAHLLHMDNAIGTLEAGKLADILVVKGDVLADISTIVDQTNIRLVLKGGRAAKNMFEQRVPMMAGIA